MRLWFATSLKHSNRNSIGQSQLFQSGLACPKNEEDFCTGFKIGGGGGGNAQVLDTTEVGQGGHTALEFAHQRRSEWVVLHQH